ncbi:hypothetical protein JTE90_010716 [Oedothorax gibbosus]|uniref:Uncharacterized protein n=1 Tax=Oedothorax gibbosus TaxID=931172 RepID=A0AAV6UNT0_9ARAC|nr:hypothetical protein JTE90_010716 [Oedothorax gibbosus]
MLLGCTLKPEKLLRQHTYFYIALLFLTAVLMYYYTYPLEIQSTSFNKKSELIVEPEISNAKAIVYKVEKLSTKLYSSTNEDEALSAFKVMYHRSSNHPSSTIINNILKPNTESNYRSSSEESTMIETSTKQSTFTILTEISSVSPVELPLSTSNLQDDSHKVYTKDSQTHNIDILNKNLQTSITQEDLNTVEDVTHSVEATENNAKYSTNQSHTTYVSSYNTQVNETQESSVPVTSATLPVSTSIDEVNKVNKDFLVYSKNCRIPNIDPMHPSILEFVKLTDPLVCKDEEPLTITDGDMLLINETAVKTRNIANTEFFCCYSPIYRDQEGSSDNKVAFGNCHNFKNKMKIRDEFIKVQCSFKNEIVFYENFHSFIHDKSHVEERCKKHNESKYSVLIIGVDSMSRMNMHRQLIKTTRYLLDKMNATEMYGFNKVGDNTFPNLIAMLTGYDERELPFVCFNNTDRESMDKCNFLWKRYAEKGYRTLYAEDSPHISSFNYLKKGFLYQPTDYYMRHFLLAYEKKQGHNKPLNCYMCLGSVSATEAILHWAEQFASHFSERPYFAFNWINSLTHDYMNLASSGDNFYEEFFRVLHQSGAFNRTIVIVMGDHGMRWGPIRETYIGRLEERLPMLFIALPPEFQREFPKETESLKLNSHRLITPFDIHATLVNLLHFNENWTFTNPDNVGSELSKNFTNRALSLFQPIPEDRSCDEASIEEHWCTCESSLPMDTANNHVKNSAKFLVEKLNNVLKPVSKMCATLSLKTISDARVWSPSSEHIGHSKDDNILTVIVQTSPGDAIFEGTVRISAPNENYELLGSVSRLNLYGNQSACVKNAILRKYCYCS